MFQRVLLDFVLKTFGLGAENETRTRDPNLGKVVLYQLSYFRDIDVGESHLQPFDCECKGTTFFLSCKFFYNFFQKNLLFLFHLYRPHSTLRYKNKPQYIDIHKHTSIASITKQHRDSLHLLCVDFYHSSRQNPELS